MGGAGARKQGTQQTQIGCDVTRAQLNTDF